jgi:hypothetical protein
MMRARNVRDLIAAGILGVTLIGGAGCGTSSESKTPAAAPVATPAPAPEPPPSLRDAGAQIADEAALKQLVPGKTTKADVRERFGVPQEVVLSSGIESFIYYRERRSGWFWRTTERSESLTVRFDTEGLLKDFEYRFAGK